jgi:hypothetical protein
VRFEEALIAAAQARDSRGLCIRLIPHLDAVSLRHQIVDMTRDLTGECIRMTPNGIDSDPAGHETLANNLALVTEVYAALLAYQRTAADRKYYQERFSLTERRETTMSAKR